jgi:hypothetical protein
MTPELYSLLNQTKKYCMLRFIFLLTIVLISFSASAGDRNNHSSDTFSFPFSFVRYTDFHIHPTYKHYFRDPTSVQMKLFLDSTIYDTTTMSYSTAATVLAKFRRLNWEKSPYTVKPKYKKQLQFGETSDIRNYDQSGYPELLYVPGSILCNSYSPYEKQFALSGFNRKVSSLLVTKMGLERLEDYSKDIHTPLRDFLAEYYYNLMQEKEDTVSIQLPDNLYKTKGKVNKGYKDKFTYIHRVLMVKDSLELDSLLTHNNIVFESIKNNGIANNKLYQIITPMVMSIEGAQVLYDTLSADNPIILKPFILAKDGRGSLKDSILGERIKEELLNSVRFLRNQPHRLFFITLGHFAQNHVVGFAKTLDRDPENVVHRALSALTETKFLNISKTVIKKDYEGFNTGIPPAGSTGSDAVPDSIGIGFKIVEAFLNPDSSRYKKPTYIDVKHMDILARTQYYEIRHQQEKKLGIQIPIIASHFAVSGESLSLAMATGRLFYSSGERAYFDKYAEIRNPDRFYKRKVEGNKKLQERINKALPTKIITAENQKQLTEQYTFNKNSYKVINDVGGDSTNTTDFNVKEDIVIDYKKAGWYYPWSINLFDEEIIEINKSNGIIGLLLDPRQLGAFMPNYKRIEKRLKLQFETYSKGLDAGMLAQLGLRLSDINIIEYFKSEPLIRNLFYIVNTIQQQQAAEQMYAASGNNVTTTKAKYPNFVKPVEAHYPAKGAWETVSIGGDFDGLIDPIDFAPTASYIPSLRARLVVYAYIFAQIHKEEFSDPATGKALIETLADSDKRMEQFFYSNGQKFIKQYF